MTPRRRGMVARAALAVLVLAIALLINLALAWRDVSQMHGRP